jgi:hypothetical protein
MVGMAREEAVQDDRRLLLAREGRVARRRRGQQGEGVEDGRLVVLREAPRDVGHRRVERLRTGAGVRARVVGADGRDVRTLAVGGGAEGGRSLRRRLARGQVRRRRRSPDRVVIRHGDPPLGHAALRVLARHVLEPATRFLVAERVQERGGAGEGSGRFRPAGDLEIDGAELLAPGMGVGVLLSARVLRAHGRGRDQDGGKGDTRERRDHPDLR